MDVEVLVDAVDAMPFDFAGVVRDVVEQPEIRIRQERRECGTREMREDLPVGERAIDRRAHRAEIALPERRLDRRACKLAIRNRNAGRFRGDCHLAQKIGADLMAKSP